MIPFLSVEVTAYFPEDNCKVHILVFDLTPDQFKGIDGLRSNIYMLRDYLLRENLAYSCGPCHLTALTTG